MTCENCGAKILSEDGFCTACDVNEPKQPETAVSNKANPTKEAMFCIECGTKIIERTAFCAECGTNIDGLAFCSGCGTKAGAGARKVQKSGAWVPLVATIGIGIFSLLDWAIVGAGGWQEEVLSLFGSWSYLNDWRREIARWGGSTGEITGPWVLLSVLIAALVTGIVLQIVGYVKNNSGQGGMKQAMWGYRLAVIVPLGFIIALVVINDGFDGLRPTVFFFLTIIVAIVGIVSSKKLWK